MQYVKTLGLAAIAAAALVAFVGVGSASATELTCGTEMCSSSVILNGESEGKTVWDAPFGNVECNLDITGHAENAGSSTETVKGPITTLDFTNCGSNTVRTLHTGSFVIHTEGTTANNNGTFTSAGAEIEVIHLGVQCIFTTENTDLGTLTGSTTTGGQATLDLNGIIPRTGGTGGAFCGESTPLTGSIKFFAPANLNVD